MEIHQQKNFDSGSLNRWNGWKLKSVQHIHTYAECSTEYLIGSPIRFGIQRNKIDVVLNSCDTFLFSISIYFTTTLKLATCIFLHYWSCDNE